MDTLKVALLYRGVLYVEVILYSKECNWYTRCCPLNGGVRYRECPLREAILYNSYSAQGRVYFSLKKLKSKSCTSTSGFHANIVFLSINWWFLIGGNSYVRIISLVYICPY